MSLCISTDRWPARPTFFLSDDKYTLSVINVYKHQQKSCTPCARSITDDTAAFYHVISFKLYTKDSINYTKTICKINKKNCAIDFGILYYFATKLCRNFDQIVTECASVRSLKLSLKLQRTAIRNSVLYVSS